MLLFTTCKKYPQGGLVGQSRLHLFGGHNTGCSKTWKLKLYEVDGIDSTYLVPGASAIPNYYEKFITLKLNGKGNNASFMGTSFFYNYAGDFDAGSTLLIFTKRGTWSHDDSTHCYTVNNAIYCCNNILIPEGLKSSHTWKIDKLKKSELIITNNNLTHSYKIILTH